MTESLGVNRVMSVKTRKPDFIGIGAMKAGTSWLAACLRAHPQIYLPRKDLNFWSRDPSSRDIREYEERFGRCPQEKICGEFSTSYLDSILAWMKISKYYPDAKIIMCLREPVDRAISHYKHLMRYGKIPKAWTIRDAISAHPQILYRGRYAEAAGWWLQNHECHIIIYDTMGAHPSTTLYWLYEDLHVDPLFDPPLLNQRVNAGGIPRSQWVEKSLFRLRLFVYNRIPSVPSFWWSSWCVRMRNIMLSINRQRVDVIVSENEREFLKGYYGKDVEQLEGIIGCPGFELPEGWK